MAGRNFTADELANKQPVLIMNQSLAKRLWPNTDAVGQHLRTVSSKQNAAPVFSTVIGVVTDTHQLSLESAARPEITKAMIDFTQLTMAVRTNADPTTLIASIKHQIWTIDPHLPLYEIRTMQQVLEDDTGQRRFQSLVMTFFAGFALALASIGIFGVLASLVSQRTQEIGIRMALGAQTKDVLTMILAEGFRLVMIGAIIGLAGGMALIRYLSSLLFGVSPGNPITYLEVALLMIAVALIACLLPAWRAIRVNPMVALRYE